MSTATIILPNSWSIEEGKNLLVKRTWIDKFDYAEVEVSEEQHFFFEANGLRLRLSVGKNGFNLWDDENGQWILDASTIGYLSHIDIGKSDVLRGVTIEQDKDTVGDVRFNLRPKKVIELLP
jgi:hypothetical protein